MLRFPQLMTGAIAQFPLTKRVVRRSVINEMPGGNVLKLSDPDGGGTAWELQYKGLTEDERTAIENLFRATEGRLRAFTFVDPTGNLLRWSEDFTKTVWEVDGMLQVTPELPDPRGGLHGLRIVNTGQVFQEIQQTVSAPGSYSYCFSLQVRSSAPAMVKMKLSNSDGELVSEHSVGEQWSGIYCSGSIEGDAEEIISNIGVPPGAALDVYGLQLSAQTGPSDYRRTFSDSGVFIATRFSEDSIQFTAHGVDDHSVVVRLWSGAGRGQ